MHIAFIGDNFRPLEYEENTKQTEIGRLLFIFSEKKKNKPGKPERTKCPRDECVGSSSSGGHRGCARSGARRPRPPGAVGLGLGGQGETREPRDCWPWARERRRAALAGRPRVRRAGPPSSRSLRLGGEAAGRARSFSPAAGEGFPGTIRPLSSRK